MCNDSFQIYKEYPLDLSGIFFIDLLSSNVWQISPNMFNDNMKTNKILIKF